MIFHVHQSQMARDDTFGWSLRFAVTQQGLVRISGHWAAGGREILPEQQAQRGTVNVWKSPVACGKVITALRSFGAL